MSDLIQWAIAGLLVAAAAVYLIMRLRPSKKGCCAGCPYAGSCQNEEESGSHPTSV
jgi:hypothetical protein